MSKISELLISNPADPLDGTEGAHGLQGGASVGFTMVQVGDYVMTRAVDIFTALDDYFGSGGWPGAGSVADFTDLADVPGSYTGDALKAVRVNTGETGLEFYTPSSGTAFSVQTETANYSTVSADFAGNKLIEMNVASSNTLTVDPSMANDEPLAVAQMGAGQTTIVAGAGVTLLAADGALKLRVQNSLCSIMKVGTNTYRVSGDLET